MTISLTQTSCLRSWPIYPTASSTSSHGQFKFKLTKLGYPPKCLRLNLGTILDCSFSFISLIQWLSPTILLPKHISNPFISTSRTAILVQIPVVSSLNYYNCLTAVLSPLLFPPILKHSPLCNNGWIMLKLSMFSQCSYDKNSNP